MLNYSIIQKSQLEGAHRLDAEYFQPEYLELERKMRLLNLPQLKDLNIRVDASAFYPSIAEYYGDEGVPFVRVSDVLNLQLAQEDLLFLPDKIVGQHKTLHIGLPGDIIITKGGTVGNIALLPENYPKYALSRDIIFIKTSKLPKEQSITILLFLASSFGLFQLIRGASLQVQPHLTLPLIRNLHIPHKIIKSAINEYYQSLDQMQKSKNYYSQAEELLLGELGLKDFQVEDDLSFVVNLSEVEKARRVDAEYFQPKYERLVARLKAQNAKPALGVIENVPAKFNSYSKPNEHFKYVELSNINTSTGSIDGYGEVLGKEAPSRAKRVLKMGDVIASSVEGSLEKVALVDKEQEGYLASTGFFQLRSKEILPEVLLILAKSIVLQMQFQKHCVGTILTAVSSESLQKMFIPTISEPTQQKIAGLVRKSHEARKKSKELLEQAKREVEEMIDSASSLQVEKGND